MTPDEVTVWLLMVFTSVIFVVRSPNRLVRRFFTGVLAGSYGILFVTVFAHILTR